MELDQTHTSINIRTSTDLKLLKATSDITRLGSVLKKGQTSKKDLRIKIKPEFLPKEEQETHMTSETLFEITQKVLPDVLKKLATQKVH